jgi:hypothetical protein
LRRMRPRQRASRHSLCHRRLCLPIAGRHLAPQALLDW